MSISLKIDPRKVQKFADLGLPTAVLAQLKFPAPLPIQTKILALNSSGISTYATSVPRQGKTTAAMLGLLATPRQTRQGITNLVLVPTPALADQYIDEIAGLSGSSAGIRPLYRTGSVDTDEQQHSRLLAGLNAGDLSSLVATPQRFLDYLSADPKLLPTNSLHQIVIDEFDVFGATSPLETLLTHLLKQPGSKNAILTFLGTSAPEREFAQLSQLFAQMKRPMYEVKEHEPAWEGNVVEHKMPPATDIRACAKRVAEVWSGAGLVIPPPGMSTPQLQMRLSHLEGAVAVHAAEVSGLNVEGLQNIYVLHAADLSATDVKRLKWMLSDDKKTLHIIS